MSHQAVMLHEAITALQIKTGWLYVDATLGAGGHSQTMLDLGAKVIAFDFDQRAIKRAREKFATAIKAGQMTVINENFNQLKDELKKLDIYQISGILFDFGTSSDQLTDQERGLSFQGNAELDMRLDERLGVKASDLLAVLGEKHLIRIFQDYGGENQARAIAKKIVELRKKNIFIKNTEELVDLILSIKRHEVRKTIHPATKVFQALRIAVNMELSNIREALPQAYSVLRPHGRLVTIAFHEGEDHIVKDYFRQLASNNLGKEITHKPMTPSEEEIKDNPRSRSAKLRIFEKI